MIYCIIDPAQDCIVEKGKFLTKTNEVQSANLQSADMQVAPSAPISNKDIKVIKKESKKEDISIHPMIHLFKDYWEHNTFGLYNKVQFKALWDLQESLGEERLVIVLGYIKRIHTENPEYAPKIYNPTQLVEKYNQLLDFLDRAGWEKKPTSKPQSVYRNL